MAHYSFVKHSQQMADIPRDCPTSHLSQQSTMVWHKLQQLCVQHLKTIRVGLDKLFNYNLTNKQQVQLRNLYTDGEYSRINNISIYFVFAKLTTL